MTPTAGDRPTPTWLRVSAIAFASGAMSVFVIIRVGGDRVGDRTRTWLFVGLCVAFLVATIPVLVLARRARRDRFEKSSISRQRELMERRRTLRFGYAYCALCFAVPVTVFALFQHEPVGEPQCSTSASDDPAGLCRIQEEVAAEPGAVALIVVLVTVALGLGVLAAVRFRRTVIDVGHPDPDFDKRPWHQRDHRTRVLVPFAGFAIAIGGSWLRPVVESTFTAGELVCVESSVTGMSTICRQDSVEVERVERLGHGLSVPLIVVGVMAGIAGVLWWVAVAVLEKRRRDALGVNDTY